MRGFRKKSIAELPLHPHTNGMLIDEDVIDFADRQMSNVVLSLDGRREIHDRLASITRAAWKAMTP